MLQIYLDPFSRVYREGLAVTLRPGSADGPYAELYNEFADKVTETFGENT